MTNYVLWQIKSPFTFHMVFSNGKLTRHVYFLEQTYIFIAKPNASRQKNPCGFGMWKYMILRSYIWDWTENFSHLHLWTLANKYGYMISSWSKQATAFYRYKLYLSELHTIKTLSLLEWWNNQTKMEETIQQPLTVQWNFLAKFPGCYWQQS